MRDETELSVTYLCRAPLPTLETLGLVVSVMALGLEREGRPVTHVSLEVHRFLLRPIIRALPWPREHLWVAPAERIAAQEKYLAALRDEMVKRLRRRLERLIQSPAVWFDDLFDWSSFEGGWVLCPSPLAFGFEDRVWRGPKAERSPRPVASTPRPAS